MKPGPKPRGSGAERCRPSAARTNLAEVQARSVRCALADHREQEELRRRSADRVTRDHLMRFILPIAALAVALLTVRAEAREVVIFENGNNILELCSQPYGTVAGGFCLGYIAGIADAANVTQSIGETINGGTACIPMGVPVTQAKDVVTNFLRQHPEQRSLGAVDLIVRALAEAFPCPPANAPTYRT